MKHTSKLLSLGVLLAAFAMAPAFGQAEKFTIAGGGGAKNGSTYSAMLGDLAAVCSTDELPIEEVNTSGGVQNLDLLKGNKVKAALIPTSVLMAAQYQNATSVANIKTLVSMHPEEVHVIARSDVKKEGGLNLGSFNIGGDKVSFNSLTDLKGHAVGAVGGSVVDARLMNDLLHLGMNVTPFPNNVDLFKALTSGQIDAAVIVAGAPSAVVTNLPNGKFRFLSVSPNQDLAKAYEPTKIQYQNVSDGKAVDTISTRALLVSRTFRSNDMLNTLAKFRACFISNVPKLQDKDGTHPKWQDVDPTIRGKWDWYDLPTVAGNTPAVVNAPSKRK
jgi:TRAP-type uncharacterized transport system substrate-binding protein